MWTIPIFDRTIEDVNLAKSQQSSSTAELKGAMDYRGWNRICQNIHYLSDYLNELGYKVEVDCKTDWDITDFPETWQLQKISDDLINLRNRYKVLTTTPDTPNHPFNYFDKINDIERITYDLNLLMNNMISIFIYSGETYCGEK